MFLVLGSRRVLEDLLKNENRGFRAKTAQNAN